MRAYVMLKVSPQNTADLMQALKDEAHVMEANLIHGPYDCVLEIEGKDLDVINETVLRLRAMEGIIATMTCLVIQSWQRPPQR